MAKQQKRTADQDRSGMNGVDRLRLRVSAMINNPKAQLERRATIWRLDSDTELAWAQVMGELAETDGLTMTSNEDGTIILEWEAMAEEGPEMAFEEMEPAPDLIVQRLHEEPAAPF